jgi:phenylacetate-coenzyme A ligase PaaK-like adenylate-forming protein
MAAESPFLENVAPFELPQAEKEKLLVKDLNRLVEHHRQGCPPYGRFLKGSGVIPPFEAVKDLPYLPVGVFKNHKLQSVSDEDVVKIFHSSSTTGSSPAAIAADQNTMVFQAESAQSIFSDFIGCGLRPYLIFDIPASVRGRESMTARGAAIMGLMGFASKFFFVMKEEGDRLVVDVPALEQALEHVTEKSEGKFIAYGFTYILYLAHEYLKEKGFSPPKLSAECRLLHSGGWKKLTSVSVDKETFNENVASVWGLEPTSVIDFYGLTEQMGVIYPDCSEGNKHTPYWADVIIRDPDTLQPLGLGEGVGMIQLLSTLAWGAPNHSVITDDLGEVVRLDDCPCGRKGVAFRFRGRAAKAEVRGCGDIYAQGG